MENWRFFSLVIKFITKCCVEYNGENFEIDGRRFEIFSWNSVDLQPNIEYYNHSRVKLVKPRFSGE